MFIVEQACDAGLLDVEKHRMWLEGQRHFQDVVMTRVETEGDRQTGG